MRFEQDEVTIVGGVRHGRTLGSPVAIEIGNTEWDRDPDKWQQEMSVRAEDGPTKAPLTQARPGHADLAGMQKYGFTDARDVLERASARETAARVAAGTRRQGAAGRARRRHREPRDPDGRGPLEGGHPPRPGRPRRGRRVAGALLRRRGRGRDGRRDQGGGQGRRHPRRHRRGARLRRARRPRQPRALGPQARRAARPRPHDDPGREGRRDRRRLRGRRPAGERGPRPDHLGRGDAAPTGASPRWPAASRAACPPARCSSPGPR